MTENANETRISRRTALKGIAGVAASSSLAGCSADALPTDSLPGNYKKDLLRYGQIMAPISLDPVEADDPWSGQVIRRVFQSLYVYDRKMNLTPVLADGQPKRAKSGKKYIVTLRDGPTFQSGQEVSASDVKYSFEAIEREGTPNLWLVNMIDEIRVPDNTTIEFHLKYPYPNFEQTLTQPIVPEGVREKNTSKFGRDYAVGSGPYKTNVFKPGKYAVLDRWEEYWSEEKPKVNWLKFINVHSGLARTMSLKTGQNDVVERIQPKFWSATKDFPNARVTKVPSHLSYYLGFNTTAKPMSNPRVREAVDYLVSMDQFVEKVVGEAGERQYSPLPPRMARAWDFPVEAWAGIPHKQNTSRARTILQTELSKMDVSGWTPKIAAPHNDFMAQKLAKKLAHEFRMAGFRKARANLLHWRHFQEKTTTGNQSTYAIFVTPRSGGPDPDSFLYPMAHENMQGLTNGTYYNDEGVMEGIAEARRTTERPKRRKLYETAITTLLEDRAIIPAFTIANSFGVKSHVSGFEPHPMGEYNPMLLTPDGEPSLDQNRQD